ncbi:hypothetical protein CKS_4514 [Pantoea stewartii subsp. stewartii DC283]|uniref:Uncharacterized protein n=1 Tax=Pantoea stewartii subsp. stewartii DC283 TaxID=660596 RepID=C7E4U8_PANSE|nr:hypothetical protein [Pantoea stewartii subsp. stewartii DC283]EHT98011.1 hypothetical protein CKS_4514 [Pantoea stewartii subsp. stewartii DC283]
MALYKVGTPSAIEPDWTIEGGVPETTRQLGLNDSLEEVGGCMLFRHMFLREPQTQQVVDYLRSRWVGPARPKGFYPIDYNSYHSNSSVYRLPGTAHGTGSVWHPCS